MSPSPRKKNKKMVSACVATTFLFKIEITVIKQYVLNPHTQMAHYEKYTHLLTYMEQTTPNEFGETLMELSEQAIETLAAETAEMRLDRQDRAREAEEWNHDFKALLLLNMAETKRISKTYRGSSSEIGKVMEAAVLEIRKAYFEAKAEAKAMAQEMAMDQATAMAQEMAQQKAMAHAELLAK
jgi:hypothetical protein